MCHDPSRQVMRGMTDRAPPNLGECIAANLAVARLTSPGVRMAGIALNTSAMDHNDAVAMCLRLQDEHGLPCTDPHRMGVEPIIDVLLGTMQDGVQRAAQA
jgi:uncharacterized NAD-dependent epimerase/dehydratase family protein